MRDQLHFPRTATAAATPTTPAGTRRGGGRDRGRVEGGAPGWVVAHGGNDDARPAGVVERGGPVVVPGPVREDGRRRLDVEGHSFGRLTPTSLAPSHITTNHIMSTEYYVYWFIEEASRLNLDLFKIAARKQHMAV